MLQIYLLVSPWGIPRNPTMRDRTLYNTSRRQLLSMWFIVTFNGFKQKSSVHFRIQFDLLLWLLWPSHHCCKLTKMTHLACKAPAGPLFTSVQNIISRSDPDITRRSTWTAVTETQNNTVKVLRGDYDANNLNKMLTSWGEKTLIFSRFDDHCYLMYSLTLAPT